MPEFEKIEIMHPDVSQVLQSLLNAAISDFINEFNQAIKNGTSEVNLAHHLLIKINKYLPNNLYDTDLDYNRMNLVNSKSGTNRKLMRPDIVIHKRGSDTDNRLVIEVKTKWTGKINLKDKQKLEMLTNPTGNFHYDFGLFLAFNLKATPVQPVLRWFKSGNLLTYQI